MKKKIIVIIVTVFIIIALISVIFFRPKYRTTGHIFCMMDNNVIELEGSFLSLVTGSNGIYEGDIIFTNEDDEVVIEEIPHY